MSDMRKFTDEEATEVREMIWDRDDALRFLGWMITSAKFEPGVAKEIRSFLAERVRMEKRRAAREKREVAS